MLTAELQRWIWRITAALLWVLPPALAGWVHHEAMDALLFCTAFFNDWFVDHPGLYGFWAAIVYIQLAALSAWAVLHSKRPWRLWAVLILGGLGNLLVRSELPTDRVQYEPSALATLFGPMAAHGDTVVAVRLVWIWLIVRELAHERQWRRGWRVLLCVHPVLLGLGARWWNTNILAASAGLYLGAQFLREIRPLPKAEDEAVLGEKKQVSSSQFTLSGHDEEEELSAGNELPLHEPGSDDETDLKRDEDGREDSTAQ
jgi:hypothetical protein